MVADLEKTGELIADTSWYPVYTHPRAEKKAFASLTDKGIQAYLPLHKQEKQWSDRRKIVLEPLFKSYLFVRISRRQQAEVLMTRGICRFLYFSGKVATMPDRQIRDLKLLLDAEVPLEAISPETLLPGEKVVIKAGPLKGLLGELIQGVSQKRLLLRIDHIGSSLSVQVPLAYLERLQN